MKADHFLRSIQHSLAPVNMAHRHSSRRRSNTPVSASAPRRTLCAYKRYW